MNNPRRGLDARLDDRLGEIQAKQDEIMMGLRDHFYVGRGNDVLDNMRWLEAEREAIEDRRRRLFGRD